MTKKTTLRKRILTRYIECMVLNGIWIENVLGVALRKFNYKVLIDRMETHNEASGCSYVIDAEEIAELRKDLSVINKQKAI
jgi:hypothetical protein|tara:strand:+ start:544 stop:786 length:243 start_codon:yes stop_codon:yes gene_type:complete